MEQKIKNKRDLRNYLNRLNLNSNSLEQKAEEILSRVNVVMNPYVTGERGETLQRYYSLHVEKIREAYQQKQFSAQFPDALRSLITALECD